MNNHSDIIVEPLKFHLFVINDTVSEQEWERIYRLLERQIKDGLVVVDKRVSYEGLK